MKPPKAKTKKKKSTSSPEDDKALWQAVTETVEPLKGRDFLFQEFVQLQESGALAPAPPTKRAKTRVQSASFVAPPPPPAKKPLPELNHGSQPGLDKATAKRLRRGKVEIEGRIDLHGMTQDDARPALERFIEAAWRNGKREVLVITGKGTRADGSIGILRQAVPQWLNASPNRERVTAFVHAAPKDGGEGALYVRIKRRAVPS
ncbi:MAG TPA: Smr/MutS family protein [Magnetovibrio sp.]